MSAVAAYAATVFAGVLVGIFRLQPILRKPRPPLWSLFGLGALLRVGLDSAIGVGVFTLASAKINGLSSDNVIAGAACGLLGSGIAQSLLIPLPIEGGPRSLRLGQLYELVTRPLEAWLNQTAGDEIEVWVTEFAMPVFEAHDPNGRLLGRRLKTALQARPGLEQSALTDSLRQIQDLLVDDATPPSERVRALILWAIHHDCRRVLANVVKTLQARRSNV